MKTLDLFAEEQGASKKDVKRAEKNEQSISAAGTKLVFDNMNGIFMRAIAKNYNILDCVVIADMCQAPPSLFPMPASDFFAEYRKMDLEYTKQLVARNRSNGALSVVCISTAAYNQTKSFLFKTIPSQAIVTTVLGFETRSWRSYQIQLEQAMGPMVEVFRRDPDQLESMLNQLE